MGSLHRSPHRSRIPYDSILERRVVEFTRGCHEPDHQVHNRGIANVRIDGEWDTLEVDIGNKQIDKIHRLSGTHVFDIFENGSCIPFLKFHRIQFMYTGSASCMLSYDIVSLDAPEKFEFAYKSQQYTGKVDTSMPIQSVPLSFNNLIEKLTIHCEYPVTAITFFYREHGPSLPVIQKTKSIWVLDFSIQSVNFSQLDYPFLCIQTPTTNTIRVFATGIQLVQSMHGLIRIIDDYQTRHIKSLCAEERGWSV